MAIVVEDGSGSDYAANSYVSLEESRAFLGARGLSLPDDDAAAEALLVRACDYLESFEDKYQGSPNNPLRQSLQWPRYGVIYEGFQLASNVIPNRIKQAQIVAAEQLSQGNDPMATTDGRVVIREKIDVLETEFSNAGGGTGGVVLKSVNSLLRPFLKRRSGFLTLKKF